MLAIIQRNQIRFYKDVPVIVEGVPTGATTDTLSLGIKFTEHPTLPTYGIRVDVTGLTTQLQIHDAVKVAILAFVAKGLKEQQDNEFARVYFDSWGWSDTEFETDNI